MEALADLSLKQEREKAKEKKVEMAKTKEEAED